MLKTTQCQKPLPVGASGSYIDSAKLLVPLGAPLQLKAGDTLAPLQPKLLNTCSLATVAPSLSSALVTVMLCALAAPTLNNPIPSVAIRVTNFVILIPS